MYQNRPTTDEEKDVMEGYKRYRQDAAEQKTIISHAYHTPCHATDCNTTT